MISKKTQNKRKMTENEIRDIINKEETSEEVTNVNQEIEQEKNTKRSTRNKRPINNEPTEETEKVVTKSNKPTSKTSKPKVKADEESAATQVKEDAPKKAKIKTNESNELAASAEPIAASRSKKASSQKKTQNGNVEEQSPKPEEVIEAPKKRGRKPTAAKDAEQAQVVVVKPEENKETDGLKKKSAKNKVEQVNEPMIEQPSNESEKPEVIEAPKKRGRKPTVSKNVEPAQDIEPQPEENKENDKLKNKNTKAKTGANAKVAVATA
jgi:hypothetical protein